jgi:hypothetical protein
VAEQRKQPLAPLVARDRGRDTETLAAALFVQLAATASQRGKTPRHLATEAQALAREFYSVLDEIPQPTGLSAPAEAPPG